MDKQQHMPGKGERGAVGVEFALITMVFFIIFFAILDFSRLWWDWNQAVKATQRGARFAVTSTPVHPDLIGYDAIDSGVVAGNGQSIPAGTIGTLTCTSTTCSCSGGSCTDLGSGTPDSTAFNALVAAMRTIMPTIQPQNIRVTYRQDGLGFAGNPYGPDFTPSVTVELTGMTFVFVTPGLLGLGDITLPPFSTTLTGEDLSS